MKNISKVLKDRKIVSNKRVNLNIKSKNIDNKNVKISSLLKAMKVETVPTSQTENGAVAFSKSGNANLDLFSIGATARNKDANFIIDLFRKSFNEDKLLALKNLFYIRDVRGGQGERKVFHTILKWLADNHPNIVKMNISNIPLFGRYDDLFVLFSTKLENDVMVFINNQLAKDLESDSNVTLLAKWCPSINSSSKEGRLQGRKLAKFMGLSERNYRKVLSHLRNKINLVEKSMCARKWDEIDYEKVPSRASMIYRKAFGKNDKNRYVNYLNLVKDGKAKINTSTLYPYDLVRNVVGALYDDTINIQWNNLPNYLPANSNILTICDVSSSMDTCISDGLSAKMIAMSLSLYTAERALGLFKNHFITFSENPTLEEVVGNTLREKVNNLSNARWGGNTNFQAALDLILKTAIRAKIPQKEMPTHLICVSDMGFDQASGRNNKTNFEVLKEKYKNAGYKQPIIVFWRVNQLTKEVPATMNDKDVVLVGGFSPAIFESVLSLESVDPLLLMLKVLNKERYNVVKV